MATTDVPVLLLDETSTGRELTARALHARRGRGAQAFIAVNWADGDRADHPRSGLEV